MTPAHDTVLGRRFRGARHACAGLAPGLTRRFVARRCARVLISLGLLTLPGCPLSDDYFIVAGGPTTGPVGGASGSGPLEAAAGAGAHAASTGGTAAGGGATSDAGAAGASEAALGPFGAPTLITAASSSLAEDDDPCFTADRLELYFNSDRPGGPGDGDIWVSTRASAADPWGPATLVAELSSAANESTPRLSPDGLTLWFSTNRAGCVGANDIWLSTRTTRGEPWSAPSCLQVVNSPQMERSAAVSASLVTLVLTSDRPGVGGVDLYWTTRPSLEASWGPATPIPGVNSTWGDGEGQLVSGGLELYFASNRNGEEYEILVASRPSLGARFDTIRTVTELNSVPDANMDPWLSEDGRYIVFSSTRSGNGDLYEASRR